MFCLTWTKRDFQSACLLCFYSAWFLLCLHNKRDADCAPDGGVLMVFLSKVISQQHDYNDFTLKMQSASFMYLFIYFHNKFIITFPFLRKTDECVLWGSDYALISFRLLFLRCIFLSLFPQIAVSGYIFATCFLFAIQKRAQLLICISFFLLCSRYRAKDQGTVGEKMTDGQGIRNTTHRDGYY